MAVRVLVLTDVDRGDAEAFEAAFAEVAARMKGTRGHIRDELLRDADEACSYVLVGDWTSREDFQAWFDAPDHPATTTPLRPYWAGRARHAVYDVVVRVEPG